MNDTTGAEVLTIIEDSSYDFNFQEIRYLKDPIQLLPGHRIDVECTYETNNRDAPVVNGLGTKQEMCLVFLYHYPKVSLKTCWSDSWYYSDIMGKHFGWSLDRDLRINSSVMVEKKDYIGEWYNAPLLDPNFWRSNESRAKKMERLGEENPYFSSCRYSGNKFYGDTFVNKPRALLPNQERKPTDNDIGTSGDSLKNYTVWVVFITSIAGLIMVS